MRNTNYTKRILNWNWRLVFLSLLLITGCELTEDITPATDLPEVSLLNGEWLRVDGNNEPANGMRVSVTNGTATILDPSATSFTEGNIKWKDITPASKDLFDHQELGSDGNYYDATISVKSDNEIEINVANSGAGNLQKWIRVTSENEYVQLQGTWTIVTDNGTIIIEVKGGAATVVSSTDPDFNEGDIIWKDILFTGSNEFTFLVLGENGTYTSGSITIINVNQVIIIIGSGDPQQVDRFSGSADLVKIQGEWTRINSNNPSADYIKVNVVEDEATIIDKAQSGFSVGDIKWKSITALGAGDFSHEELGSDGNYYAGSIRLKNDSTLEITVGSSGAGNAQTWVRNPPAVTVELECDINSATRLVNTAAAIDYRVKSGCVVDITADLIIEPGVVIEFENNSGFGVYDNGSINAVGDAGNPIIFKGLSGTKGSWRGIHVETNSVNNRFEYVTIQDAGSNYVYCCNEVASLIIKSGQFAIENSTIQNGEGVGMYVFNAARLSGFMNNTITTHDDYPLFTSLARVGELDGLNSDFSGNQKDYIAIIDSRVDDVTTVDAANVPYLIDDVIDITAGLTITNGAEFAMRENAGLGVYDEGYLKIQGTASSKVVIRGFEAVEGYWRGIHIETSSINNSINHAEISDAGSNYVYCCNTVASVFYKTGRGSITNTKISNGANYGIYAGANFKFEEFANNTITTHDEYPMYIAVERVGELDGTGSAYSGNTEDYIGIFNSNIDNGITWSKANVPYLIDGIVIDIKDPVVIEKGTEIVFAENAGLGVYDQGTFNAVGTSGENITFRGKQDVVGYWRGIHIETNSQQNRIEFSQILNAGSNYVYCCNDKAGIYLRAGRLDVLNSTFAKSGGCGISVRSGANLTESGNLFSNNTDGSICQ